MIGCHCRMKSGILGAVLRGVSTRREEEAVVQKSYTILKKIGLEKHVNEFAKNLPYGAQRRLEIARAMATDPFMLLLDEPAAGMNPQETHQLDELILKIRETGGGISILLIEHDMKAGHEPVGTGFLSWITGKRSPRAHLLRSEKIQPLLKPTWEKKSMLSLVDIHTYYGNIQALKGVSLEVEEGEIITLIGANGAGKTTTLMSYLRHRPAAFGRGASLWESPLPV